MKEFRILLEEREINDDLEPISRKTVANQYMSSPIEDDEYYEYVIKQICQETIDKFIEQKDEMPSIPVKSIKDHDRELVKEVCEKIEDWCNKNFNWVGDGTGYDGQDYNEMIGSNNTINKLRGFLKQIKKDFEDE